MTWAIAIAYGLLAMAGEALHLLPGCAHHSANCCVVTEAKQDSPQHEQCEHAHVHRHSSHDTLVAEVH